MTNNVADKLYDRPTAIQLLQIGGVEPYRGIWTWGHMDIWGAYGHMGSVQTWQHRLGGVWMYGGVQTYGGCTGGMKMYGTYRYMGDVQEQTDV